MSAWSPLLCEYTLLHLPNSLRKLVRKLLLSLTGHRDKYRAIRDVHALDHHIKVGGPVVGATKPLVDSFVTILANCSEIYTIFSTVHYYLIRDV